MLKKSISLIIICLFVLALILPVGVLADEVSRAKVEDIISGNQDYLVLANIIEKGTSAYEVQVFEEITAKDEEGNTSSKDTVNTQGEKTNSDKNHDNRIFVEGFDKYMYYDNFDYRPQKGDNVLLSLKFNGNSYTIKNGAYRVDSTSHEQFSFLLPESFNGSQEALELSALYIYINSNGEIKDLSIKEDAIYGKDANGNEKKMEITSGLKFLDEFGDTSEKQSAVEIYGQTQQTKTQSKWHLVVIILLSGAVSGIVFVRLIKKYEKRYY